LQKKESVFPFPTLRCYRQCVWCVHFKKESSRCRA